MKRAVVVGLGDISAIHLNAIKQDPGIELAAVCDIDETAKDRSPKGVPFYTDYMEMIKKEKPDVAHICLPHYLHVPVSEAIAEEGVNVLCEKPVALNTVQALEFASFEASHPEVHIGIVLQNRLNRTIQMLKKIVDSREYGEVIGTRGLVPWSRPKEYYDKKPWRGKWETAGGGCMINQAVHTLDLLYYLGGPIDQVKASVSQLLDYGIEVEDTVSARLDYANGAHGMFEATVANHRNEGVQVVVRMEKAEYQMKDNILFHVLEDGTKEMVAEDDRMPGSKFYYGTSHAVLIHQFYQAMEEHTQNYLHVKDAVMSIRLIDAIQQSGRFGKTVRVSR